MQYKNPLNQSNGLANNMIKLGDTPWGVRSYGAIQKQAIGVLEITL